MRQPPNISGKTRKQCGGTLRHRHQIPAGDNLQSFAREKKLAKLSAEWLAEIGWRLIKTGKGTSPFCQNKVVWTRK